MLSLLVPGKFGFAAKQLVEWLDEVGETRNKLAVETGRTEESHKFLEVRWLVEFGYCFDV